MRSRLDRAEHAIEQERAANRDLRAALQACQQVCSLRRHSLTVQIVTCRSASLQDSISAACFEPTKMRQCRMASGKSELGVERLALQGGAVQADGSAAKMAAELAALRRDLTEAHAALASQKASNKGLQIRVAELLKGSINAEALQASCMQLRQERDALLASKHQWTTNETCRPIFEQPCVLHVILLYGWGIPSVRRRRFPLLASQVSN